ncbi:hypothetical protein L3X38_043397 [Prunus dulcis]|uniref:Uncharacterized protein n=1 Tax=Prunus dulcis TaxID=3755 RepID=A0AAD4UYH3_PRUDU|nr:hypothetical protein L3X38_043397 [Prunus dulcis]
MNPFATPSPDTTLNNQTAQRGKPNPTTIPTTPSEPNHPCLAISPSLRTPPHPQNSQHTQPLIFLPKFNNFFPKSKTNSTIFSPIQPPMSSPYEDIRVLLDLHNPNHQLQCLI